MVYHDRRRKGDYISRTSAKLTFVDPHPATGRCPAKLTTSIHTLPRAELPVPRNYISRRLAPASLTKRENSKFESKLSYSEFSLFVTPAGFKPTTF